MSRCTSVAPTTTPAEHRRAWRLEFGVVAATVVSYPLGLWLGSPWVLPLLNVAPAYAAMVLLLRGGERSRAIRTMLVWAASLALVGTLTFRAFPTQAEKMVLHGTAYRDEMFRWIRTGEGSEGKLQLFLPLHLRDLAAFVLLSLLSASFLSILMGSVLVNYMDFYVASLSRAGVPPEIVLFFGWQPYALCRVAAFCTLGVVLAEPLLSRIFRYPYPGLSVSRRYLAWAGVGILADWGLKVVLAPMFRLTLSGRLG